jgi:hypothetical protein
VRGYSLQQKQRRRNNAGAAKTCSRRAWANCAARTRRKTHHDARRSPSARRRAAEHRDEVATLHHSITTDAVLNMASSSNLSPSHRPPRPSLDRGPIQVRTRRAFIGSGLEVMGTPQIAEWTHPRNTSRRHAYRYLRDVCERYCIRVGRSSTVGRPILWRLRTLATKLPKQAFQRSVR